MLSDSLTATMYLSVFPQGICIIYIMSLLSLLPYNFDNISIDFNYSLKCMSYYYYYHVVTNVCIPTNNVWKIHEILLKDVNRFINKMSRLVKIIVLFHLFYYRFIHFFSLLNSSVHYLIVIVSLFCSILFL